MAVIRAPDSDLHVDLVRLLPRLRRFALSLTGSTGEAEELVQAACERILSQRRKLPSAARLDVAAYAMMRALWADERRGRRAHAHDGMIAAANVIGADGERTVGGVLTLAAVRQTLAELPPDLRVVLVLICVDGLRYSEVAQTLGIPLGTVISRVARGREELRRRLDEESPPAAPLLDCDRTKKKN